MKNIAHVFEWGFMWGGIPTSIISLMKEFDEYKHHLFQLNKRVTPTNINYFIKHGAAYTIVGGSLREKHLKPINPDFVFIHSCNKVFIHKANLDKYNTITMYHYNTEDNNDYHGDLNWFVSEHLYSVTKNKPQNYIIQPPPCYVTDFSDIERPNRNPVVGRIQSHSLLRDGKFSEKFFDILKKINAEQFIVGPKESNAPVLPGKMQEYLKNVDLFLIWGDTTETWSLVTTEANLSGIPVIAKKMNDGLTEQLKKSGGGILVDTEDEFLDVVELLLKDESLRKKIGETGKNWCIKNASTKLARSYLTQWITPETYNIHKNYTPRKKVSFLNTEKRTDEYQDDVYKKAFEIAEKENYKKILDFGCSSGYKLIKYFNDYITKGYDLKDTVDFLKKTQPDKNWCVSDFSKPIINEDFDLMICADVIEHIENPNDLIDWILKSNIKKIIISTPDRDLLVKDRKHSNDGPPINKHHFREWSFDEFHDYMSRYFNILEHFSVKDECGQIIVCEKINLSNE